MMTKMTGNFWRGRLLLSVFLASTGGDLCHAAPQSFPCAEEIDKYCKNLGIGGGRIQNCLKEHQADLSSTCRSSFEASLARHKEIQAACGTDVERLCKNVPPGKGRVASCLKQHHRQVSSACKDTLSAMRAATRQAKSNP